MIEAQLPSWLFVGNSAFACQAFRQWACFKCAPVQNIIASSGILQSYEASWPDRTLRLATRTENHIDHMIYGRSGQTPQKEKSTWLAQNQGHLEAEIGIYLVNYTITTHDTTVSIYFQDTIFVLLGLSVLWNQMPVRVMCLKNLQVTSKMQADSLYI